MRSRSAEIEEFVTLNSKDYFLPKIVNPDQFMRVRINYAKTEAMRFTGHLDLYKTWERTLRRAGLPLAYSQGFNPRPKINLSSALPLGFTSQDEIIDIWLKEHLGLPQIEADLRRAAPPGIKIISVAEVDLRAPALQTQVLAAAFVVTLLDPVPDLAVRVEELLRKEKLPRARRAKEYDLRPLIQELTLLPDDDEQNARLFMRLNAQEGATGRPDEVLDEMGISPQTALVIRIKIIYAPVEEHYRETV